MKICQKCSIELELSCFWKNARGKDGLSNWCKECWYANDHRKRGTDAYKARRRNTWIKEKYNIDSIQYDAMLLAQEGKCAICRLEQTHKRLAVDHDHNCCKGKKSCGKCVRGLLCDACNKGIGNLRDDIVVLESAISYLKKY